MCDLARGRSLNCSNIQGGVKRLLFFNSLALSDLTISATEEVEGIEGSPSAYEWLVDIGQAGATSTFTGDRTAGTFFYSQEITATLTKLTKQDRQSIYNMSGGRPAVIVETRNGEYLLFGIVNGMALTGGTATSGTASADTNGYTLTLTSEEPKDAYFVDADVIANEITLVQGTQGS